LLSGGDFLFLPTPQTHRPNCNYTLPQAPADGTDGASASGQVASDADALMRRPPGPLFLARPVRPTSPNVRKSKRAGGWPARRGCVRCGEGSGGAGHVAHHFGQDFVGEGKRRLLAASAVRGGLVAPQRGGSVAAQDHLVVEPAVSPLRWR